MMTCDGGGGALLVLHVRGQGVLRCQRVPRCAAATAQDRGSQPSNPASNELHGARRQARLLHAARLMQKAQLMHASRTCMKALMTTVRAERPSMDLF